MDGLGAAGKGTAFVAWVRRKPLKGYTSVHSKLWLFP